MSEYRKDAGDIRTSDVKIAEVADRFPPATHVVGVRADNNDLVAGHVKPGGYGVIQEAGPRQGKVVVDVIPQGESKSVPCLADTVCRTDKAAHTASELAEKLANVIKAFPPGTEVVGLDHVSGRPVSGVVGSHGFGIEGNIYLSGYGRAYVLVASGQITVKVYADTLSYRDKPVELPGTTKIVTLAVTARFTGDYYDAEEAAGRLEVWINSALDDRDDLRSWDIKPLSVTERPATASELD